MLRSLFILTCLLCFIPFVPGVLGLLLPAFTWLPALGYQQISVSGFSQVFDWPGWGDSLCLSLITGLSSSLLSLLLCYRLLSRYWLSPVWLRLERSLSPLLAMPHVALAIGLSLLLAPNGWLYRLVTLLGIDTHNSFNLVQDRYGLGLILMLAIKETPFLVLMSIPVLKQLRSQQYLALAQSLGYSPNQAWRSLIFPLWLPRVRLAFFAVIAYGLSVVDVALIIGPSRPPTFAVLVWQWFNEPELRLLPRAAAAALMLLMLTGLVLSLIRGAEWILLQKLRYWQCYGAKLSPSKATVKARYWPWANPLIIVPLLSAPLLLLWSLAQRWRFPDIFPSHFSLRFWLQELPSIYPLAITSLVLAFSSSLIALALAIACLEFRQKYQRGLPLWLLAIPLIIPQLSVLFGLQVLSYWLPGQHFFGWVLWSHLLFVFPYVYLSLEGTWRAYDQRLDQASLSLGKTVWATWWQVKRPQIQTAIIFSLAIGLSVSLSQYLPTQMLGAGRIATLTTEAVSLSSGQDRRVVAIYGLLQGLLPLLFFTLAIGFSPLYEWYRQVRRHALTSRSSTQP